MRGFSVERKISVFPNQFANVVTDTSLFDSKLVILGGSIRSGCHFQMLIS